MPPGKVPLSRQPLHTLVVRGRYNINRSQRCRRGAEVVAAADHTPAAAWETSLQRTSGKVELPLAASDAPMGGPKTSPTGFECLRGWSRADTCRRALAWLQHWAFACQLLFGGRSRAARRPMTRLQRLVFCIMRQGRGLSSNRHLLCEYHSVDHSFWRSCELLQMFL